jgi:hypothetical protein
VFNIFEQDIKTELVMNNAELKIVFHLLQDKGNAGKTFREIATETGTSVGSVHSTLTDLTERGYIIDNGMTRVLRKRSSLIDRWAMFYGENMKGKLFLCRFKFLTPEVADQWQNIVLPDTLSWSGEPAAALLDGYLTPQRWDIYTADTANPLISTGRMIPDPQGGIFVYRKFWKEQGTPLLIIYADLLATQDDRCREAAGRIKPLI